MYLIDQAFVQHVVALSYDGFVQQIQVHQMVAHLVGGIGEQDHHLLAGQGDALEQKREAISAQDGEGDAHGAAAGLGAHVGGDVLDGGIVALGPGHDGFGDGHHVPISRGDARLFPGGLHGLGGDGGDVVALTDDGRSHAPNYSTDGSHTQNLLYGQNTSMIGFFRLIIQLNQRKINTGTVHE